MAARLRGRGDEPKRCRGNVARNREIARLRDLVAKNADGVVFFLRRPDQKIIEHQLGVVPAEERLAHRRFALGEKTGEQQRAFYLGTGDRQNMARPAQLYAMDFYRRGLIRSL